MYDLNLTESYVPPQPDGTPARPAMTPLTTSHAAGPSEPEVRELTLGEALAEAAREWPDRVALIEGRLDGALGRAWTYAELLNAAERAARALRSRFEPGDRIAVWAHNISARRWRGWCSSRATRPTSRPSLTMSCTSQVRGRCSPSTNTAAIQCWPWPEPHSRAVRRSRPWSVSLTGRRSVRPARVSQASSR